MRFLSAMILSVMASGCFGFCGGGGDPASTEASVYVTDSSGEPVALPQFTENGANLESRCGETDPSTQSCVYEMLFLSPGTHAIKVSADGYVSEVVQLDTTSNDSVHLAVSLARALTPDHVSDLARR